jgi:uncharacterized protein DUF748
MPRLRRTLTGVPFLVTVAVVVVLLVAYTLAGFLLVPRLIRTYVPRYAEEQLKRRAEIGEVRWNPLLFKLEIKHFRLQEPDGRPLVGFDRLFVDFELTSLFRAAWTFADIELDAPRVDAVLTADGRLNLAELLDALPKSEPAKEPTEPPRVLLHHTVVRDGTVSFTDLSRRTPQTVAVQPINVELHDVTTLRERRGPYTIEATLKGGGVVGWDGEISLVPVGSTGRFGLRGFPLATAWRFVQDQLAVAEPGGTLDAAVRYQFGYRDGATTLTVQGVEVAVKDLALAQRHDKAPLLALEKIELVAAHGDLIAREVTVPEISVSRGRVTATMARDGTVDWQTLVTAPPAAAAAPPAAASETRPWRLAVEKLRVEEVALGLVDHSRAAPLAVDVAGLDVGLSARLESGSAGLAGVVEDLAVTLARVAVREAAAKTPVLALDRIAVTGGRIDLGAQHVAVSGVAVKGGATTVVRNADGTLPAVTMLGPAEPPGPVRKPAAPPARASASRPTTRPWTVALGKLELNDHRVTVTDRSVTPAVELGIGELRASVRDVRTDGKKPWPFDASFRVVQGGRFTARGTVAPDGRAAEATLTLRQLALAPAQPYVARSAAVVLSSGEVSTTGRLTYRARAEGAAVTYTGLADVDRVLVLEAANNEPVLAWKSLHAETIRFGLGPDRVEIDEVRLGGLDGRFVIFQDKSTNIGKLMNPSQTPAAVPAPSALPANVAGGEAASRFPVTVGRVRLDESAMHFADLSLVLPFAARVHSLTGVVAGLGSDPQSRAAVKLDGRVDEFGLLKVDGALSAFQPKIFTDLTVVFRNVPMSTLSPYSATFAGRRITAGTMDLDLEYKIDHSALVGENKVVLQQLQLGERVSSPGAMRLPLDLAIAILSDSEGRIDLALPVRGNVDHPEFSYGHVIWQALVTVITKVVTSPFRALGALFGADAESVEAIAFEPGSDVVLPPERQKLKRVAEVLGKRPRLKVTVHGTYEEKADGEALRASSVRRDLAQRLEVKLKPGEDPGPVALDDAKTQRALEALLTERGGDKAVDELVASYEKTTGKKADRASAVLALVGRGGGDRAFYEAVFRRLVELAPLPESELTALARRRGEATVRALTEGAGTTAARAEAGDTEVAGRVERKAVPTRLELGAVGS